MSWFSSTFSLSAPPMPEEDRDQDDGDDSPRGQRVTDEISVLTKNLTRSLWGVASFLAPPPTNEMESPKHTNTPQTEMRSTMIAEKSEVPQVGVDVVATEEKGATGSPSMVGVSVGELSSLEEIESSSGGINSSSASSSTSVSGNTLTGVRSDLAELKGTMATGFSRIQTVIRAVTQDEDEDEDIGAAEVSLAGGSVSGSPQNLGDDTLRDIGLTSLLKPLLVSMSSFRGRLSRSEGGGGEESRLVAVEQGEGDMDYEIQPKPTGRSSLGGSIGGLSRLANSFIPFARDIVGEISRRDYYAVGLTDEVVSFADNIAGHPETFLEFPFPQDEDDDGFEMTEIQEEHTKAVEQLSSKLEAVHRELCPAFLSDGRFWKIYFALLHSRLSKEDAELLSTPQILKIRELLLQPKESRSDTASNQCERVLPGLTESNMRDLLLKSSVDSAPLPVMEEVSLDDASRLNSESSHETVSAATEVQDSSSLPTLSSKLDDDQREVDPWLEDEDNDVQETADRGVAISIDEDVSFSDLEEDDEDHKLEDESHAVKNGKERTSNASLGDASFGSKPEGDWLTINIEDAASVTSSSP